MLSSRIIGAAVLAFFLGGGAWAAMPVGPKPTEGIRGHGPQKPPEARKAPAVQVLRATALVEKIEDGVLYTPTGRYSLAGVRVLDLTRNQEAAGLRKGPKKTAEMTLVDGRLTEVVIRQRQ